MLFLSLFFFLVGIALILAPFWVSSVYHFLCIPKHRADKQQAIFGVVATLLEVHSDEWVARGIVLQHAEAGLELDCSEDDISLTSTSGLLSLKANPFWDRKIRQVLAKKEKQVLDKQLEKTVSHIIEMERKRLLPELSWFEKDL